MGKEAERYHSHHYSLALCGNSSGPAHGFAGVNIKAPLPLRIAVGHEEDKFVPETELLCTLARWLVRAR